MSTDITPQGGPPPIPSWGWQPKNANRNDHPSIWAYFAISSAIMLAIGIVIPFGVHDGGILWPLTLFGSAIIIALLSAAAVPHLRQH